MATLLLIGGTGFFGKCFISYYKEHSFKKWGIDDLVVTSRKSFTEFMGIKCIQFDASKDNELPDCDYVIYAASSSDKNIYINESQTEFKEQEKENDVAKNHI